MAHGGSNVIHGLAWFAYCFVKIVSVFIYDLDPCDGLKIFGPCGALGIKFLPAGQPFSTFDRLFEYFDGLSWYWT